MAVAGAGEITRGGTPSQQKLSAAISAARRYARGQVVARHGTLWNPAADFPLLASRTAR